MSHRQRRRSTHLLTASRRVQNGTDAETEPIYNRSDVVSDEPVRFQPGGTSFVREDGGEPLVYHRGRYGTLARPELP